MNDKVIKAVGDIIGIDWNEVDFDQFKTGLELELDEHGSKDSQTNVIDHSLIKAGKIALAHLKEMPDYYAELQKMEKQNESLYDTQTPLNFQTISDNLVYKLGKQFGSNLSGYNIEDLKNGMLRELEDMQTYTLQALNSEKLVKAFSKAYNNIKNNPGFYNNKKSAAKYNKTLQEKFDFNKFKKLNPKQQSQFLFSLPEDSFVSEGSSRAVFIMGNGKAIKLATNKAGLAQNKKEVENYKKYNSPVLPKIYDYDPEFHWLMVELVKPMLTNEDKYSVGEEVFKKFSGLNFEDFYVNLKDEIENNDAHEKFKKNKFFSDVVHFIKKSGISYDELETTEHFGIGADGRIVILDTGLDTEVYRKYYKNSIKSKAFEVPDSYHKESLQLKYIYKSFLNERRFFNIGEFKSMSPGQQATFLYKNGNLIGEGSSRRAYLLDSKTVLKFAKNEKGYAQNKKEVEVFKDPSSKGVVAKIYDYDTGFAWLVSEIARPLNDNKDFENVTGMNWNKFRIAMLKVMNDYKRGKDIVTDEINNPLVGKVMDLVFGDLNMVAADLMKLDSWGKTADGRLVLVDYGYDDDIWEKHYKKKDKNVLSSQDPTATKEPVTNIKN